MVYTVNGPNRQRDVYFILGVEERAFDKWEAFKRDRCVYFHNCSKLNKD